MCVSGGGGGGGLSKCIFLKGSKSKIKKTFLCVCVGGGGEGGGRARVSEFFFTKDLNQYFLLLLLFFLGGRWGGLE